MYIPELILLAVGLSMDAFAVAICKGLALKRPRPSDNFIVGLWFGVFQGLMPFIGYLLANAWSDRIEKYDHWIAFGLLALIGANMIKEAFSKEEEEMHAEMGIKSMLLLAIATSIDALAVGVTFSVVKINIIKSAGRMANSIMACVMICIVTFCFSYAGVTVGAKFGSKNKKTAEIVGGVILIIIGIKVLLEHTGVL